MAFVLARLEERLRVRLHQAANRMEDADPASIALARVGVRALDGVDRVTGFRAVHANLRSPIAEGVRGPPPTLAPAAWLAGRAPQTLDAETRARLRQGYRAWEKQIVALGFSPLHADDPTGGRPIPVDARPGLEAAWSAWQALLP